MKRLFLILAIAFTTMLQSQAGGYKVYYIAHNSLDRIKSLVDRLSDEYDRAIESGWEAIFYLANRQKPIIATTDDGRDAFNELISKLQLSSELELDFDYDNNSLINLFDKHPFTDNIGNILPEYDYIDVTFYVNSDFWDKEGNEDLIGSLYYALDCENNRRIQFAVYRREEDTFNIANEKRPLGPKVAGSFLDTFDIFTY